MSLAWQLAWQFRQNKSGTGLLSFISMSSILGVGLGCFVLIVLLSVMNGFERELKDKVLSRIAHGEFIARDRAGILDWQGQIQLLSEMTDVQSVQPRINTVGMVQKGLNTQAIEVQGIRYDYLDELDRAMTSAKVWQQFQASSSTILLTQYLAQKLSVVEGDNIQLLLPQPSSDGRLKPPKILSFEVAGIMNKGSSINNSSALVNSEFIQGPLGITTGAERLQLRFSDPFEATRLTKTLGYDFEQAIYLSDWTRTQGHLYNDIKLVRVVIFISLMLLIAVACFNIVSTLFMAVNEKQAAIAVLKTMGADDQLILKIFMLHGMINGCLGAVVGTVLGTAFALTISDVVIYIEQLSGKQLIAGDVYFIDFLPSALQWQDVLVTLSSSLLLCFLATIYPAQKAANLSPSKVLSH